VDLAGGVAVRVSALCLDSLGRLADRLLYGTAVRAGLMLDLALAGRLESEHDSIVVDGMPTGFAAADRLLAAIAVEPERSLDEWLDETRLGLRDVAEANVASGRWQLRRGPFGFGRRYVDRSAEQTALDLRRPLEVPTTERTPEDACVIAIACASGLLERDTALAEPPPAAVPAAAGRAEWLCTAVVEHLLVTGQRYRSEAGALGAGPVGPF
jgi:Golgi phosphoprotein 3 (GPP34)